MDKLEHYLDQVCRGIAGPRSLRQHIRLELKEHLREAIAQHQAAGLSPDDALAKALEDFGGPEQVSTELQATHGHRVLTVILDKAMQWKEKTMKAKWIWSTWAHAAVLVVIALATSFIYGCVIFILPKVNELARDHWIDTVSTDHGGPVIRWCMSVLLKVSSVCEWGWWILLGGAAIWALFEWRIRSENKSLMRLAALGTVAAKLLVAAFLTAAALILPLTVTVGPYYHQETGRTIAEDAMHQIEAENPRLEAALTANDAPSIQRECQRMQGHVLLLHSSGAGMPLPGEDSTNSGQARIKAVSAAIRALREAASRGDQPALMQAAKEYRQAYAKLRPAAPAQ